MTKGTDSGRPAAQAAPVHTGASEVGSGDVRVAHLQGHLEALRAQAAALEAADEHRRAELTAAHAELADAQAAARELRARLEERKQLVEELRSRLEAAEADKARAERERAAVIACLGWRAKRRLSGVAEQA